MEKICEIFKLIDLKDSIEESIDYILSSKNLNEQIIQETTLAILSIQMHTLMENKLANSLQ